MCYEIDFQIDDEYSALIATSSLQKVAELTLSACNIADASLTIVITNDEEVRTLNREYRNVDAATDVLSFPSQADPGDTDDEDFDDEDSGNEDSGNEDSGNETNRSAKFILPDELLEDADRFLGDIIIAYPYTLAQAAKYEVPIASELRLMTVHGILHLLGYDHGTLEDETEMWQIQTEILNTFGDQIDLSQRVYDEEEK